MFEHLVPSEVLRACLDSSSDLAWTNFVRCFQPDIARRVAYIATRYRLASSGLIDDLVQETYLRLCRNDYRHLRSLHDSSDDHIRAYIRKAAVHAAEDYFASIRAKKRGGALGTNELLSDPVDPTCSPEETALLGEVESCLQREVEPRDRVIYQLCRRQGYTAREIAEIPEVNLSAKGVESCIRRIDILLRAKLSSRASEGDLTLSPFGGEG